MTTTVKVTAHCADNTEVHVRISHPKHPSEIKVLQDGESVEVYAYDDRIISVKELPKAALE